jgi:propanol-preferring alcohol dehydrogenase
VVHLLVDLNRVSNRVSVGVRTMASRAAVKLRLATEVGADHVLISDASAVDRIRELTGGLGANAVFDFVGTRRWLCLRASPLDADVSIVGIGGGSMTLGFGSIAFDAFVRIPYWGSRSELIEVLDLARAGRIHVQTETYSLDDGPKAYEDLAANSIRGRAVIVP